MIGIDWGTSSFRAFRFSPDGAVTERRALPLGIMQVEGGAFAAALAQAVGDWLAAGENKVLLSGMIGSRQGWKEALYCPCPADLSVLAGALTPLEVQGTQAFIVPGLSARDGDGVFEVMRGEETQLFGLIDRPDWTGLVCLPGTHAKWARVENGVITGFTTAMTGEVFAVLKGHSILGRMMGEAAPDDQAFSAGVARSGQAGGLLHHLFGVRAQVLGGAMAEPATASYLSGLLIGHDVRSALAPGGESVDLVGEEALCRLYALAIETLGGAARRHDSDLAAAGLARIARFVRWS